MKKKLSILLPLFLAAFAVTGCGQKTPDDPKKDDPVDDPKKDDPVKHECQHVCSECGNCTDLTCTDNKCFNKCEAASYKDSYPRSAAEEMTVDPANFTLSDDLFGLNISYYSDILSRGFNWVTNEATTETKLYLKKSAGGAGADFTSSDISAEGTTIKVQYGSNSFTADTAGYDKPASQSSGGKINCNFHKVHVEKLEPHTIYSYKVGGGEKWRYGTFKVEDKNIESITAVQISDAQTKDHTKLNYWRNTFAQARKTAGDKLDTVLCNGDLFDQNMGNVNGSGVNKVLRYAKAYDAISDYAASIPLMSAAGNHEPASVYSHVLMNDINYAGYESKGGYYSYDYGFAHFVVLCSKSIDTKVDNVYTQIKWLEDDLKAHQDAKWTVVMMHIGPFTTGDHSNDSDNQWIAENCTPIFSKYHVDLVLQAHEHTYNKTLPYKWDAAGYTATANDSAVVNFKPTTKVVGDITYDYNSKGTYYVTTGAAGHRCGADESSAGIWAEVVVNGGVIGPALSSKTFLNNKYRVENGTIKYANKYTSYTESGVTVAQDYKVGDPATGNVNGNMFGVLELTKNTLNYNIYTVNDSTVKLFDSLDVYKD